MTAFEDWRDKARSADMLQEALRHGAKMKRYGKEWKGPCIGCGGSDRFSINPKGWYCRGENVGGGDAIGMLQHALGLSFLQACEALTGEPPPNGHSKPLSPSEQSERENRRAANEAAQRQRQAKEEARESDTKEAAQRIFGASISPYGTIAEKYLISRGIPRPENGWPQCLRFHPMLPYPKKSGTYPALICGVEDISGETCAVWRVFLRADGRKLDVENAKLGLGPAGGGAVRIGGLGSKIGLAEGVESALGAWNLIGRKYPVWAALSTSGLVGIELPLGVEQVTIFPDGDSPIKKHGTEFAPAIPAGRKASMTLRDRLVGEGLACTLAAEPNHGLDYLDIWQAMAREVA